MIIRWLAQNTKPIDLRYYLLSFGSAENRCAAPFVVIMQILNLIQWNTRLVVRRQIFALCLPSWKSTQSKMRSNRRVWFYWTRPPRNGLAGSQAAKTSVRRLHPAPLGFFCMHNLKYSLLRTRWATEFRTRHKIRCLQNTFSWNETLTHFPGLNSKIKFNGHIVSKFITPLIISLRTDHFLALHQATAIWLENAQKINKGVLFFALLLH
jgi:hypothetical protein